MFNLLKDCYVVFNLLSTFVSLSPLALIGFYACLAPKSNQKPVLVVFFGMGELRTELTGSDEKQAGEIKTQSCSSSYSLFYQHDRRGKREMFLDVLSLLCVCVC